MSDEGAASVGPCGDCRRKRTPARRHHRRRASDAGEMVSRPYPERIAAARREGVWLGAVVESTLAETLFETPVLHLMAHRTEEIGHAIRLDTCDHPAAPAGRT